MDRGIDSNSGNSQSTSEWGSTNNRISPPTKKKDTERSSNSANLQPLPSPSSPNVEVGPSREPHHITKPQEGRGSNDEYQATFASCSRFPPSVLPRAKIRGTEDAVTDWFHPCALGEIDDIELFQDLPLLGPPPQRADHGEKDAYPKPYWGISSERFEFFSKPRVQGEEGPIQVSPTVQANVERYHQLKHQGLHFNQVLIQNRSFKNPHVYSQLVDFLDINETRSNLAMLDTGRVAGGWRNAFPFSEQQRIEGDPNTLVQRQKKQSTDKRTQQLHQGHSRKIEFAPSKHNDQTHTSTTDSRTSSWEKTQVAKAPSRESTSQHRSRNGRDRSTSHNRAGSNYTSSKRVP